MELLQLAILVISPAAAPQQTATWRTDVVATGNRTVITVGLDALDDGGCLWVEGLTPQLVEARPFSWRIARMGRDGETRWERYVDAPTSNTNQFSRATYVASASDGGASAVALQQGSGATILRHDPNGTRLPNVVVAAPNPSLLVSPTFVWTNDQGEVVLGALERSVFVSPMDWRMTVRGFDVAGQELWRHEAPAGSGDVVALANGGWLLSAKTPFLNTNPNALVELVRVNPSGNLVARTTVDAAEPFSIDELRVDALTGGTMLVGWAGTQGDVVVALDGNDAVLWSRIVEQCQADCVVTDTVNGRTFFAVQASSSSQNELIALDASGNLVLESAHPGRDTYWDLAPRAGGGVLALTAFVGPPAMLELLEVDGLGQIQDSVALAFPPPNTNGLSQGSPELSSDGQRTFVTVANRGISHTDSLLYQLLEGEAGTPYCTQQPNSTGAPGALAGAGSDRILDGRLSLVAMDLPPMQFGLFAASRTQASVPNAGGSLGTLCLGGAVGRFNAPGQIRPTSHLGRISLELDLGALPQPNGPVAAVVGETWNFQLWHRDLMPGPVSNFTNALAVTVR